MEPVKGTHEEASLQEKEQEKRANEVAKADTILSTVAHLAPIAGTIIPFGGFLLLLGVFLLGRKMDSVRAHIKESLNAQISYMVYGLALFPLLLVATRSGESTFLGKFLAVFSLLLALLLSALILWNMVAAVRTTLRNEKYTYRLIFRLIR